MRVLLAVYDNGSYVHYFPHGTAYITFRGFHQK